MSFGVATSDAGAEFVYDTVFAAADAGLYAAERAGRNRVCTEPLALTASNDRMCLDATARPSGEATAASRVQRLSKRTM